VLEEQAPDIRSSGLVPQQAAYFLGDHLGFDAATRAALTALGARPISIGPRSLHTEDAIVVLSNELDRLAPQ
jgi:tRNA pseudouridine-54 N-methylase